MRLELLEYRNVLATLTVSVVNDGAISVNDGNLTLREAIAYVNGTANPGMPDRYWIDYSQPLGQNDEIRFASNLIPSVIDLGSALPQITKPVKILNPNYSTGYIQIDGQGIVGSGFVFYINSSTTATAGLEIQGLKISGFSGHGVDIQDLPTNYSLTLDQNYISGNQSAGIHLDIPGDQYTGDDFKSLKINDNVIVLNHYGIHLNTSRETQIHFYNNRIGTDGVSTTLGNTSDGVFFENCIIGGDLGDPASEFYNNVISGNLGDGIHFYNSGALTTPIQNNKIGLNANATGTIPNHKNGVHAESGGAIKLQDNEIGGNGENGVFLESSLTAEVTENYIGTNKTDASHNFGNQGDGVSIRGVDPEYITLQSNRIYFSVGAGVNFYGLSSGNIGSVQISQNNFVGNAIPIDLGNDGPTGNDSNDVDRGPNYKYNYPVIILDGITFKNDTFSVPVFYDGGSASPHYRFEFYRVTATNTYTFIKGVELSPVTDVNFDFRTIVPFSVGSELNAGDGLAAVAIAGRLSILPTSEMSIPVIVPLHYEGDYNRNGSVDQADYVFWRNTLGMNVPTYSGADGNGDGTVNVADFTTWRMNFGAPQGGFPAYGAGDYNTDGFVDQLDFDLWKNTRGSRTDLRGDGNCDHVVDSADLEVWQEMFRVRMAETLADDLIVDVADEQMLASGAAAAAVFPTILHGNDDSPLEIPGVAPVVLGVAVGDFDFANVVGSGGQLQSVAATSPNSISIRFSEEVFVTLDALQVINLDGASPAAVTAFTYDLANQTATWTFDAPFADGRYLVRLADSTSDLECEALNGEFLNPWSLSQTESSILPSGDGEAGGEFRFRFTVLAGDSDHDNIDGSTNYQNWKSYEPGRAYVSTTADDFDSDVSFGDFSLREAINYANTASEPTTIELPAGRYVLSRAGTESNDTAYNDLDVSGNVTILGAGPGLSVITTGFSGAPSEEIRVFQIASPAAQLKLGGVTLTGTWTYSQNGGAAALVQNGATLEINECAIVNNSAYYAGVGVRAMGSNVTIVRSVFTGNFDYSEGAVYVSDTPTNAGSLTIGQSIFALNGTYSTIRNVKASTAVVKTNLGNNLYDNANGGFFNVVVGMGDHLGTAQYVVTSVADTFNHADDSEALSIREAIDKANTTAGTQEIWIPAWKFVLTRDRGSATTDTDTTIGDLDVKDSVVMRGVAGGTSVAWKAGVNDRVFELLGDYNGNNAVDAADYTLWQSQNGSSGTYEQFVADGDDDGDVDQADYSIWQQGSGHTLSLIDIDL